MKGSSLGGMRWQRTIVDDLPGEHAEGVVEKDGEAKQQVLVQEEGHHARNPYVGPAPMHQQQRLQEAELRYRKIGAHDRLHALLPADAHACSADAIAVSHPA